MKAMISENVYLYDYEIFHRDADDFDRRLNGEILYSSINADRNLFEIDSKTRIISAIREFDRLKHDIYFIQVAAPDKGRG